MPLVSFAWLIAVSGTGLWFSSFVEGQGFSPRNLCKTLMLSNMETLLIALVSALACLSWLGWFEFVQYVSFISVQCSWEVMKLFFWGNFWGKRYFREAWKQVCQTVCSFYPAELPSSPGKETCISLSLRSSFLESLLTLSLSREACCCKTVCWAWDSHNDREACGREW